MKKLFFIIALTTIIFGCSNETSTENEETQNENEVVEANTNANAVSKETNVTTGDKNLEAVANNENTVTVENTEAGGDGPQMTFTETEYDFGNIKQGDKVAHTFVFTNTGKAPLIINRAQGSCGCTVPEYPKEPIAPGKTGKIHVEFNSNGKSGKQNKSVTLTTNMNPAEKVIYIKANVATDNGKGGPYKN